MITNPYHAGSQSAPQKPRTNDDVKARANKKIFRNSILILLSILLGIF
jgi:hypothetical protein